MDSKFTPKSLHLPTFNHFPLKRLSKILPPFPRLEAGQVFSGNSNLDSQKLVSRDVNPPPHQMHFLNTPPLLPFT